MKQANRKDIEKLSGKSSDQSVRELLETFHIRKKGSACIMDTYIRCFLQKAACDNVFLCYTFFVLCAMCA